MQRGGCDFKILHPWLLYYNMASTGGCMTNVVFSCTLLRHFYKKKCFSAFFKVIEHLTVDDINDNIMILI